jgi:hypothetical protein
LPVYYLRVSTSRVRVVKVVAQSQVQAEAAAADVMDDNLREVELDIYASRITAHTAWEQGLDDSVVAIEADDPNEYAGYALAADDLA